MTYIQAIILGIVQGLTEFIPISSTAHLVFASRWTNVFNGDPQQITATMAVIQLGTVGAVLIYFASDIINISRAFLIDHYRILTGRQASTQDTDGAGRLSQESWLGWLIVIGTIPIGIAGLWFKDLIEGPNTKNLWVIATMLIAIALLLALAEFVGRQKKDLAKIGFREAVVVGLAQVLSLIPGASRSGSTIMGGLFVGLNRETAARFSFLLSIPAISAAGILQLKEAWSIMPDNVWGPLMVSTLVSGVIGYLSIWFMLAFLRRNSTMIFIVYRLILGTVILFLLWQGVLSPVVNV